LELKVEKNIMKKKYLFIILSIFSIVFSNAQTENDKIKSTFYKYRKLIEQKNYDKAFDYYHKSFLKYVPKKNLEKEFVKLDNDPNFTFFVNNSKLISISRIINYDSIKYTIIKYGAYTHIKFKLNASIDSVKKIKKYFKQLYGENYSYLEENNEIVTYKEQELIGINDDNSWHFIIFKDKIKPYLHIWIPKTVLEKLLLLR